MTPAPIAIQLYTLREEAEADFARVIARLGEIGFQAVEVAALHGMPVTELRRRIADAGMRVCATHALPFGDEAERVLDEQAALGTDTVVVPVAAPERFASAGAVRALAEELNRASERARSRGISLGYHNHFWEWSLVADGRPAYDVLFEHLEPDVLAEVDVYWARVAGRDPAQVIAALGERVRLLHMKDGPADDPGSPMLAAGRGAIDLAAAARAAAAVAWHVVELDACAGEMWAAVEESYAYLTGRGVSVGRG